ncbi:hypothetical protein H6P81_013680 [Aristolochia fimbriata]|uniref:Protein FAR1-RELATED SEQUENCE n=1 Tax=Aristolochia fimbriata TaxID=158543 RepID=A0AAV7EIY8_ARIFI|nr:hypothetical protein H6P81_013680 [Aristolochia fimbriata]
MGQQEPVYAECSAALDLEPCLGSGEVVVGTPVREPIKGVMGDHWSDASGETNSQGVTGGVYRARIRLNKIDFSSGRRSSRSKADGPPENGCKNDTRNDCKMSLTTGDAQALYERDAMSVVVASGVYEIPSNYILKRWTKDARSRHVLDQGIFGLPGPVRYGDVWFLQAIAPCKKVFPTAEGELHLTNCKDLHGFSVAT